jgi:hypothetical protein
MNDESARYPIGKFAPQESYTASELASCIQRIESLPARVKAEVTSVGASKLDTPYREGGWTARQVIHHLSDSHLNAFIRIKWTLTEDTPTIKAYDEKAWAETAETKLDPAISIQLLSALHVKFVELLKRITPEQLKKEFTHPETKKLVSIERMIALYAWHGDHHLGHLKIVGSKP